MVVDGVDRCGIVVQVGDFAWVLTHITDVIVIVRRVMVSKIVLWFGFSHSSQYRLVKILLEKETKH